MHLQHLIHSDLISLSVKDNKVVLTCPEPELSDDRIAGDGCFFAASVLTFSLPTLPSDTSVSASDRLPHPSNAEAGLEWNIPIYSSCDIPDRVLLWSDK